MATKKELRDRLWPFVETTLEGYGDMIDNLIYEMPLEKLKQFVERLEKADQE